MSTCPDCHRAIEDDISGECLMCGYTWGSTQTKERECSDCHDFMEETPMHCYLCCRPICEDCAIIAGDDTTDVICKPCRVKEQCSQPHTTIETPDALVTLYGRKTMAPILKGGEGHDVPSVISASQMFAAMCGAAVVCLVAASLWLLLSHH